MVWRQSFVFSKETQFGKGHDPNNMLGMWYAPPPGSEFKCSCAREVQKFTEVGRRVWKDAAYGKISGTWTWSFPLDYNYLEPFMFVYDSYTFEPLPENTNPPTLGKHTFKHTDEGITPSFCVRIKTLYTPVGGEGDEVTEVFGCLCTGARITTTAGESWSKVILQGVCTDFSSDVGGEELTVLAKTDYTHIGDSKRLVEYMCMKLVDTDDDGNEIKTPLGAVGSMSVQTTNSIDQKYSVLNSVARSRVENAMTHQVSCSVFGVDPRKLRHRVYSGGVKSQARFRYDRVMPLPKMCIEAMQSVYGVDDIKVEIGISNVVIKMMQFMDESTKIYDILDSADCTDISMEVINEVPCKYDVYTTGVIAGEYPIVIRDDTKDMTEWNVVGQHLIVSE